MLILRRLTNCSKCGYPVKGHEGRVCPECGTRLEAVEVSPPLGVKARGLAWGLCLVGLVSYQLSIIGTASTVDDYGRLDVLADYVHAVVLTALLMSAGLFVPAGLIFSVLWLRGTPSDSRVAATRRLVVYAAATTVPVAVSSLAYAFMQRRRPGFYLMKERVPEWAGARVLDLIANPISMIVGCVIAVWLVSILRRLTRGARVLTVSQTRDSTSSTPSTSARGDT